MVVSQTWHLPQSSEPLSRPTKLDLVTELFLLRQLIVISHSSSPVISDFVCQTTLELQAAITTQPPRLALQITPNNPIRNLNILSTCQNHSSWFSQIYRDRTKKFANWLKIKFSTFQKKFINEFKIFQNHNRNVFIEFVE